MDNSSSYYAWNAAAAEQGDSSSAEEVESPRSVVGAAAMAAARRGGGRWRRWRKSCDSGYRNQSQNPDQKDCLDKEKEKEMDDKCYLHSQVLRIKEEEMQISEDLVGDYYSSYNYVSDCHPLDDVWCKAILPASPLGGSKKN